MSDIPLPVCFCSFSDAAQSPALLLKAHKELVWRNNLHPSCFTISKGKVLLVDINYPSPMKREIHMSSLYTVIVAGKLRQSR